MHPIKALTINPATLTAWLDQASDEDPKLTRVECLGLDDQLIGPNQEGLLPAVGRVLAAALHGLYRRPDITGVALWLIPNGDSLTQAALITVELANGVCLATGLQDTKDLIDHGQHGASAVLTALHHLAAQECLLTDTDQATNYQATKATCQAGTQAPADPGTGVPSTAPVPVRFTEEAVNAAVNRAADDILDAVDAPTSDCATR